MHLQLERRPGTPDVSADGLVLAFAATPGLDVVATAAVPLAAGDLVAEVEVLAASHRVRLATDGQVVATEQVACLGAATGPLPAAATHRAGAVELSFRSQRPDLDHRELAVLAAGLRALDDAALVVSFPGHPDAITSVRVVDDGWETWHLYPGERPHAVRTRTVVTAR